jgi:hypothetical protein
LKAGKSIPALPTHKHPISLEDLKAHERTMYELDNSKDQVMTIFKVALVNLVMWTRDRYFPATYDKRYNQDLEALCERINAVAPCLPDGRHLHFSVQVNEVGRPILDVQKRRVA